MAAFVASKHRACSIVPSVQRCFSTSSSMRATYGFIGLGRMGYPMAKNLRTKIPKSDKLIVHDVNAEITAKFAGEHDGVEVAKHVREIAEQSDTILTVLPEPHHVQNVFKMMLKQTSESQSTDSKDRLFIDCSTIDPKTSATVARAVRAARQGRFVDAPMSGGVVGAANGTLTFMIGASEESAARATKILELMGKRVIHLGPQTSGLKGKLANNYLLALNNVATCEAMNMGVKWGLDAGALADMINTSTGKCWPSEVNNPAPGVAPNSPASKGYEGGFGTALMMKDLRLAMVAAEESGIKPELGPHAQKVYQAVEADEKLKSKDFSIVYKWLQGEA